jgi:hypothetical protein
MLLAGYQARSFFEINRQIEGSDGKSGVDLFFRTDGFFGPFLINVQEGTSKNPLQFQCKQKTC